MEKTEYYSPNDGSSEGRRDTLSMLCFSSLSGPEGLYIDTCGHLALFERTERRIFCQTPVNINSANECLVRLAEGIQRTQPGVSTSDETEWGNLRLRRRRSMKQTEATEVGGAHRRTLPLIN